MMVDTVYHTEKFRIQSSLIPSPSVDANWLNSRSRFVTIIPYLAVIQVLQPGNQGSLSLLSPVPMSIYALVFCFGASPSLQVRVALLCSWLLDGLSALGGSLASRSSSGSRLRGSLIEEV
jgi:hypothetical protein